MKNYLLLFLLFAYTFAHSQQRTKTVKFPSLPLNGSSIQYNASIPLDSSISKATLFDNGLDWYKHNLQSSDNRLSINNAEEGTLSGPGIIHAKNDRKNISPQDIFFTIDIKVAKGGYQYRVDSIYGFENRVRFYYTDMYNEELYPTAKPKWTKPYRQSMLLNMNREILQMTDKLRRDMAKK